LHHWKFMIKILFYPFFTIKEIPIFPEEGKLYHIKELPYG